MTEDQQKFLKNCGYSDDYIRIRASIEATWPQWKIDIYNNTMRSAHSLKLGEEFMEV